MMNAGESTPQMLLGWTLFRRDLSLHSKVIILIFVISSSGLCDPSFQTDRGNRKPAVLGPPILDEDQNFGNSRPEPDKITPETIDEHETNSVSNLIQNDRIQQGVSLHGRLSSEKVTERSALADRFRAPHLSGNRCSKVII